jgi:hypothetical protein
MDINNMDFIRQFKEIQQRFYLEYLVNPSKYNEIQLYKIWNRYKNTILNNYITIDSNKIELKNSNIEALMCEMNLLCLLLIIRMNNQEIESVLKETYDTFERKNSDYGNSFLDFGRIGLLVRLVDKLNRLSTLENKQIRVTTEQRVDTILDIYNYTIILMFNY